MRTRAALVVVAAGAVLAAGCGGDDDGPVTADPHGATVSVLQYRSDVVQRRVQLEVRAGTEAITVRGARLVSPRFTRESAWPGQAQGEEVVIKPGEATDLPVPVPPVACGAGSTGPDRARIDLRLPDGGTGSATLPLTDRFTLLDRLHGDDCRREAVDRIANLEVRPPLRVQGSGRTARAFYDLVLTPTGAPGAVTVVSIGPTTLVTPARGDAWRPGVTVSASTGPQRVPLELRPARCDPHAIAEDKLGTVLPITVHLEGGGDSASDGLVQVVAPVAVREQVYGYVSEVCGNP